jgi:hypothetical protein
VSRAASSERFFTSKPDDVPGVDGVWCHTQPPRAWTTSSAAAGGAVIAAGARSNISGFTAIS